MQLINLYLRKKEHEIQEGVSEASLLRKQQQLLQSEQDDLARRYAGIVKHVPATAEEAMMNHRYLEQLHRRIQGIEQALEATASELQKVLQALSLDHGEKKAIETFEKKAHRNVQRAVLRRENESAYESFSHRTYTAR